MSTPNEILLQKRAQLFHLFSHEERLRILDELRYSDACVCHLQHILQRPQVYVSQQLHILREAGVIESYRDGQYIFHRLVDPMARTLLEQALGPTSHQHDCSCPCPHCHAEVASRAGAPLADGALVQPEETVPCCSEPVNGRADGATQR